MYSVGDTDTGMSLEVSARQPATAYEVRGRCVDIGQKFPSNDECSGLLKTRRGQRKEQFQSRYMRRPIINSYQW